LDPNPNSYQFVGIFK